MTQSNNVREKALNWWGSLLVNERLHYGYIVNKHSGALSDEEIEAIYLKEHPTEAEDTLDKAAERWIMGEGGETQRMYGHHYRSFKAGANWQKEKLKALIEELEKMKSDFYMNICRAYNAGKQNMNAIHAESKRTGEKENFDSFVSSHNYFLKEFPEFKTNVP